MIIPETTGVRSWESFALGGSWGVGMSLAHEPLPCSCLSRACCVISTWYLQVCFQVSYCVVATDSHECIELPEVFSGQAAHVLSVKCRLQCNQHMHRFVNEPSAAIYNLCENHLSMVVSGMLGLQLTHKQFVGGFLITA